MSLETRHLSKVLLAHFIVSKSLELLLDYVIITVHTEDIAENILDLMEICLMVHNGRILLFMVQIYPSLSGRWWSKKKSVM